MSQEPDVMEHEVRNTTIESLFSIGEYKSSPQLSLDYRTKGNEYLRFFKFGVTKAKIIVDRIEELKKFVAANE